MQLKGFSSISHVLVVLDHKNPSLSLTPGLRLGEISKTKIMQAFAYCEPYRKSSKQGWSKDASEQEGQVLLKVRPTLQLQVGFTLVIFFPKCSTTHSPGTNTTHQPS